MEQSKNILAVLATIEHPEYNKDIVSLEMIENLEVTEDKIKFTLLTKRIRDPFESSIRRMAIDKLSEAYPSYSGSISILVKEPSRKASTSPKKEEKKSDSTQIKNIIAISSGKGGVGKSTVTANIAVQLAKSGYRVGVIDADIYGPSQPKMFGVEDYMPTADEQERITPAQNYGVKVISIGFFIKPTDALVWRGPMATNALKQLVHQTAWGELDYLLIDLPPGTGDVHLTMLSELKFSGAIIVGTPQKVALADVVRGISMFRTPHIDIPIIGIVENMSWFTPAELPNNRYYIFGKDGVKNLAEKEGIKLLAQIPLMQSLCEGADNGAPNSLDNREIEAIYQQLISNL